jgi:hypothetical protein
MEPDGSLLRLQEPATSLCSEQDLCRSVPRVILQMTCAWCDVLPVLCSRCLYRAVCSEQGGL